MVTPVSQPNKSSTLTDGVFAFGFAGCPIKAIATWQGASQYGQDQSALDWFESVNLDMCWLKDDALEESANLPAPEVIAAEIPQDLQGTLEQLTTTALDLKKQMAG